MNAYMQLDKGYVCFNCTSLLPTMVYILNFKFQKVLINYPKLLLLSQLNSFTILGFFWI